MNLRVLRIFVVDFHRFRASLATLTTPYRVCQVWDIPQRLRKYPYLVGENDYFIVFYGPLIPPCVAGKAIAQHEAD